MRGLLALLVTIGIAVVAGTIGYQIGIASNVAAAGSVVWLGGWGIFPGLFFLFFLVLVGFMLIAFSGRRRAWGHGPWGHEPWTGNDPRRQWIADAHRRLHEEEATAGRTATPDLTPPTAG